MKRGFIVLSVLIVALLLGCGGSSSNSSSNSPNEHKKLTKPNQNKAPIVKSQSISTDTNTSQIITLSGTDPDGDALTYMITAQPNHGTLTGTAPNLTYTPTANYNGSDSFKFKVSDGKVESGEALVNITVNIKEQIKTYHNYNFPYKKEEIQKSLGGGEVVLNQSWVVSYTLDEEQIKSIIAKYPELSVIGYNENIGVLIEYDKDDYNALKSIELLKYEKDIADVFNRALLNTFPYQDDSLKAPQEDPDKTDYTWDENPKGPNWHLEYLRFPNIWNGFGDLKESTVGVCDGGLIDTDSKDIVKNEFEDRVETEEYLTVPGSNDTTYSSHTTAVASTIVANRDNNIGISGINDIAEIIATPFKYADCLSKMNYRLTKISQNSWGFGLEILKLYYRNFFDNAGNFINTEDNKIFRKIIKDSGVLSGIFWDTSFKDFMSKYKEKSYPIYEHFYNNMPEVNELNKHFIEGSFVKSIKNIIKKHDDVLFVFSAGNGFGNGMGNNPKKIPGTHKKEYGTDAKYGNGCYHGKENTLIVTSIILADNGSEYLPFYADYGESVDIAAPSAYRALGTDLDPEEGSKFSNYYNGKNYGKNTSSNTFSGTSSAAPVVSGVASMMLSVNPDLTPSEIKQIMINTSTKKVARRFVKPGTNKADLTTTEKLVHEIPILNAYAAIDYARKMKNGEVFTVTHKIDDPAQNEVTLTPSIGYALNINGKYEFSKDEKTWTEVGTISNNKIKVDFNKGSGYYRLKNAMIYNAAMKVNVPVKYKFPIKVVKYRMLDKESNPLVGQVNVTIYNKNNGESNNLSIKYMQPILLEANSIYKVSFEKDTLLGNDLIYNNTYSQLLLSNKDERIVVLAPAQEYAVIKGRVINFSTSGKNLLDNATIKVFSQKDNTLLGTTTSDNNGEFVLGLSDNINGLCKVVIQKEGYETEEIKNLVVLKGKTKDLKDISLFAKAEQPIPQPNTSPIAPTNIKATYLGGNQVELTWTDNSDNETGFEIIDKDGNVLATVGKDLQIATITLDDIQNGMDYDMTFGVRAKGSDGAVSEVGSVSLKFKATIETDKASTLLKTGQIKSYTKYDDGYYQVGKTRNYTKGVGKVTDRVTGYVWEDDIDVNSSTKTLQEARDYCSQKGLYWRLPTRQELSSLVSYQNYNPSINEIFTYTANDDYWTNDTYEQDYDYVWQINFAYGTESTTSKRDGKHYVRCIYVNDAPVANAGIDKDVPEEGVIHLSAAESANIKNIVSYKWKHEESGQVFEGKAIDIEPYWDSENSYKGINHFTLTMTDTNGKTYTDTITVTVVSDDKKIKQTGQTKSYAKYDDAYYKKGIPRKYTHLDKGLLDRATALLWDDSNETSLDEMTWQEAKDYCRQKAGTWRLPTRGELSSLIDYSRYNPAVKFMTFRYPMKDKAYWSRSESKQQHKYAWTVNFAYGTESTDSESSRHLVRCVDANITSRANAGVEQFVQEGEPVVLSGKNSPGSRYIDSYFWSDMINNTTSGTSSVVTLNNLTRGIYQFMLETTQINGEKDRDSVQVTVVYNNRFVKKTNQTKSYTDYDDGYYRKGKNISYTHSNGGITDEVTGLTWEDVPANSEKMFTWYGARDYCRYHPPYAKDVWRLPTREELSTLIDYARYTPAINDIFTHTVSESYWSVSSSKANDDNAWHINFAYGTESTASKENAYHVRCVKSK